MNRTKTVTRHEHNSIMEIQFNYCKKIPNGTIAKMFIAIQLSTVTVKEEQIAYELH
jgi:hypothetical protein